MSFNWFNVSLFGFEVREVPNPLTKIIPVTMWRSMEKAGQLAFECRHIEAEQHRSVCGYGGLNSTKGATKFDAK